jgi:hypothetical protein
MLSMPISDPVSPLGGDRYLGGLGQPIVWLILFLGAAEMFWFHRLEGWLRSMELLATEVLPKCGLVQEKMLRDDKFNPVAAPPSISL